MPRPSLVERHGRKELNFREEARRYLRARIITGQIVGGRRYTVGEFAANLGFSATPVREALGDLANAGLVRILRNRGFVVPVLTDRDLDEIFQLRLMLEVPPLQAVAGRLASVDVTRCEDLLATGREAALQSDLASFLESDRQFHLLLLQQVGNTRLVRMVDHLRDQARLPGLPELARSGLLLNSAIEHEGLLTAIVAGDGPAAQTLMRKHLEHTRGAWAGRQEL